MSSLTQEIEKERQVYREKYGLPKTYSPLLVLGEHNENQKSSSGYIKLNQCNPESVKNILLEKVQADGQSFTLAFIPSGRHLDQTPKDILTHTDLDEVLERSCVRNGVAATYTAHNAKDYYVMNRFVATHESPRSIQDKRKTFNPKGMNLV